MTRKWIMVPHKEGDTFNIQSGPHDGHMATVTTVVPAGTRGRKVPLVCVTCSCSGKWSFEEFPWLL